MEAAYTDALLTTTLQLVNAPPNPETWDDWSDQVQTQEP